MKIQDLAIIFVLIILPISLVLSAYTQYQIQTLNTQTLYDTQLTAATYDAIKAYQINAENSTTSELSNSKIRDIEASVSTFKNSIMSAFRLNGYTEEELNNYIPALVYTMYDGFYIYSPYENVNYRYEEKVDADGNPIKDTDGNIIYDTSKPAQGNGENVYGLKPYIPYSCRYMYPDNTTPTIDVVITYSLDNYITVQGIVNGNYVNESGYLIDGITVSSGVVRYNGIEIQEEQLKEFLKLPGAEGEYPYVKLNGTKYYLVNDQIIYLSNGTPKVQCQNTGNPADEFSKYKNLIENNNQAIQYYKNAEAFTKKVRSSTGLDLAGLTYENAYDTDGITQIWPGDTTKIFYGTSTNIENELSNFNLHRLAVIRHTIELNLSLAIANYNNYSRSTTNDFQMPKLKENEWDYITHNISLISFLQGLNIGGKIYNGYTIVTNSESKEVVLEPNIYILGSDGDYHRIGDKDLEPGGTITVNAGDYQGADDGFGKKIRSAGRVNLDFRRKLITDDDNSIYYYYYPLQAYNASYKSIVMQDDVTTYDDIYAYVNSQSDELKKAFYTALGREREGQYKSNYIMPF